MQDAFEGQLMTPSEQNRHDLTAYVRPTITTLNEEQILEEIGPARAYTGTLPFNF